MNIEITITAKVNGTSIREETIQRNLHYSAHNQRHLAEFISKFFDVLDEEKNAQRKFERSKLIINALHHNGKHSVDGAPVSNPPA